MTIIDGLGVSSLEFQSVWLARLAGPQHADRQMDGVFQGVADKDWVEGGVSYSELGTVSSRAVSSRGGSSSGVYSRRKSSGVE